MHVKITSEKENPVLHRKELTADVDFAGGPTPKLTEIASHIAQQKGVEANLVEITELLSSKGRSTGTARVKVWHSAHARDKFKAHKRPKNKTGEGGEAKAAPEAAPTKKVNVT